MITQDQIKNRYKEIMSFRLAAEAKRDDIQKHTPSLLIKECGADIECRLLDTEINLYRMLEAELLRFMS